MIETNIIPFEEPITIKCEVKGKKKMAEIKKIIPFISPKQNPDGNTIQSASAPPPLMLLSPAKYQNILKADYD